jgi:hypothetical protein
MGKVPARWDAGYLARALASQEAVSRWNCWLFASKIVPRDQVTQKVFQKKIIMPAVGGQGAKLW